jgi:hypothetical protein
MLHNIDMVLVNKKEIVLAGVDSCNSNGGMIYN